MKLSELVGFPFIEVTKGELSRVGIDVNGVPDISWGYGRMEIVGAVETKTNDEGLGGESER